MSTQDSLNEQDPDYVSSVPNNLVQQKAFEENARTNTAKRLREIFDREFSKEIDAKEKEVLEIQERFQKSLKTLHLLRYVIVTDYYTRKQCQLPEVQTESKQTRIHPAIKQLIGKCPRGIETNFIDAPLPSVSKEVDNNESDKPSFSNEQNSPNNLEQNIENANLTVQKVTKRSCEVDSEIKEPPKKIPRYIPPKSTSPEPAIPSRGAHNQVRRKFIIGNISNWIPPDWRDDAASHKWTVYVRRCKDDVDISEFISKVRFLLHPTYKPHDVVEITSAPFHLTRRGWGEFPIRIQLHFKNPLNRPKNYIHQLKLDRTYTGIQTLGAERVYDIWLQSKNSIFSNHSSKTKDETNRNENPIVDHANETVTIKCESPKIPIGNNINLQNETIENEETKKLKLCIRNEHDYAAMDYVVENNRTIIHLSNGNSKTDQANLQFDLSTNNVSQVNGIQKMTEEELAGVVSSANKPAHNSQSISNMAINFKNCPSKMEPLNITIPLNLENKKKQVLILKNNKLMPGNVTKNCTDNNAMETNLPNKGAIKIPNNSKTILLPSKNSFVLNMNSNIPALQFADTCKENIQKNGSNIELNEILKNKEKKNKTNGKDKYKLMKKDVLEEEIKSIGNYNFTNIISIVKLIIKKLPLITENASDPEYKKLHPYSCSTLNEFMGYNIGKQKYLEWYRAKLVRSFMKKHVKSDEELWTVREIIIWARKHGYTPVSLNLRTRKLTTKKSVAQEPNFVTNISHTRTEQTELDEWFLNCQSENNSQSDTEVDIETIEENCDSKKSLRVRNNSETNAANDNLEFLELPQELESLYSFTSTTVRECARIKFNNEEIFPGIKHCAAARVMIQALKCLVDDITRLAHARAVERCSSDDSYNQSPPVIIESDVKGALLMREEFDIFTNCGLGTKQKVLEWNSE